MADTEAQLRGLLEEAEKSVLGLEKKLALKTSILTALGNMEATKSLGRALSQMQTYGLPITLKTDHNYPPTLKLSGMDSLKVKLEGVVYGTPVRLKLVPAPTPAAPKEDSHDGS
jgi:hypothetical protein